MSNVATGTDSPSSLQPLFGKDSSGESSNPEKWFEKSNNEVRDHTALFADNEPPFFMRNSSSSETPPEHRNVDARNLSYSNDPANSLPLHTGLLQLGTDGSSTEDFRSVIDDLTIENKKLKRRLKKYEKLHDSHLKDDKLFEVRIHGLPTEKKRELEETLRKFASNLSTSGTNAFPADGYSSLLPMLKGSKGSKTASSQTSVQHADSAYASMSASGHGSTAQSGNDSKRKVTPTQYMAARRQNIHSYLHHIPEGLLPQENPASMTERAKKKLVVRRMEQLFAGKGAADGDHQHSLQQEEVSQSAAQIDKTAIEASGQSVKQEGSREAHIMDRGTEDPLDLRQDKAKPSLNVTTADEPLATDNTDVKGVNSRFAASPPHEQRPTRPLDLDPHRAQLPTENVRYMRQMGFSPLDPNRLPEEGHGWIYLNFLINMAQLHTINVTSEFVRKALGEFSNKFEISQDGRRIRWSGGGSVTRTSSNGGGSSSERISDNAQDGQSPRKRPKLTHNASGRSSVINRGQKSSGALNQHQMENNKYTYTPMFFHKEDDETEDSSSEGEDESVSSPLPPPVAGTSSGVTSSGIRTQTAFPSSSVRTRQKREDGPIIFYNNARFCTDLSGDTGSSGNYNGPIYTSASRVPVGVDNKMTGETSETRGPLAQASNLPEPMDIHDNPIPDSMEISFPPRSPTDAVSSAEQKPIELEVTGIGGVWPADNFAISVESRHARVEQQSAPNVNAQKVLPPRLSHVLPKSAATSNTGASLHKQIVASKLHKLPPSELPPALSFFGDDSVGDEDSDIDEDADEESDAPDSPNEFPPSAAPQPVGIPYSLSDDEDEESDDEESEDESDGEVDFLAAARALDPEAVREKEREYEANMAERLAEEITAGSSAATAGGGSGFASPASGVGKKERLRAIEALKRARTNNSKAVQGMQDISSDESDDGSDSDEMSDIRS